MLNRLLVEHDHLFKTLNLLEMQFLDLCRGGTPDYSLMRSLLVYIQEYPEQIHHPLEDMIFSILLEREDDISADEVRLIQDLITEHTDLENQTRKLRESVKLLESNIISREEIMAQLSAFLLRQRQHMYVEEEKVHPLIESKLTEEDWIRAQSSVPLFKG